MSREEYTTMAAWLEPTDLERWEAYCALRARVADLEQHRNGHLPTCGGSDPASMQCDCGYLQGTAYRDLRARVAELEADAERLNWLQANPRLSTIRLAGESDRECYMYAVAGAPGLKLREIIDAVRLSGNKPPQCFSTEGDDRR